MIPTWAYYPDGTPPGRWLLWLGGDVVGMALPGPMWATWYIECPGGSMVKGTRGDDIEAAKLTVESALQSRGVL